MMKAIVCARLGAFSGRGRRRAKQRFNMTLPRRRVPWARAVGAAAVAFGGLTLLASPKAAWAATSSGSVYVASTFSGCTNCTVAMYIPAWSTSFSYPRLVAVSEYNGCSIEYFTLKDSHYQTGGTWYAGAVLNIDDTESCDPGFNLSWVMG